MRKLPPFLPLVSGVGSEVVRIDPLRFLTGCHTRRLNQKIKYSDPKRHILGAQYVY